MRTSDTSGARVPVILASGGMDERACSNTTRRGFTAERNIPVADYVMNVGACDILSATANRRTMHKQGKLSVNSLKVFAIVVLLSQLLFAACSSIEDECDQRPIVEAEQVSQTSQFYGSTSLNERVSSSTHIFRGKLKDTDASSELVYTDECEPDLFEGLVHYTFDVYEYLKGEGGEEITVVAGVYYKPRVIEAIMESEARGEFIEWWAIDSSNPYTTNEAALGAARRWELDLDRQWDDREAIIMVREIDVPLTSDGTSRFWLGPIFAYAITTGHRVWLPLASVNLHDGQSEHVTPSSVGARFLMEPPTVNSASTASAASETRPATISVSELEEVIKNVDAWHKAGEGMDGYESCMWDSFKDEKSVNDVIERGQLTEKLFHFSLKSGAPIGTTVQEIFHLNGEIWLDGSDSRFFETSPHGSRLTQTKRPLPARTYVYNWNWRHPEYFPCGRVPNDPRKQVEIPVTVVAPEEVIHEAFFDPVAIGDAVGADATNGQLKPVEFDVEGGGTRSISSIEWEDGEVTMVLSSSAPSDGYDLDFIGLDGNVYVESYSVQKPRYRVARSLGTSQRNRGTTVTC